MLNGDVIYCDESCGDESCGGESCDCETYGDETCDGGRQLVLDVEIPSQQVLLVPFVHFDSRRAVEHPQNDADFPLDVVVSQVLPGVVEELEGRSHLQADLRHQFPVAEHLAN